MALAAGRRSWWVLLCFAALANGLASDRDAACAHQLDEPPLVVWTRGAVATVSPPNELPVTVEMWLRPERVRARAVQVVAWAAHTVVLTPDEPAALVVSLPSGALLACAEPPLRAGEWQRLVFQWAADGVAPRVFVDGQPAACAEPPARSARSHQLPWSARARALSLNPDGTREALVVGGDGGGLVDELRVWRGVHPPHALWAGALRRAPDAELIAAESFDSAECQLGAGAPLELVIVASVRTHGGCRAGVCAGNASCADGHVGLRCGDCARGFYRQGENCTRCASAAVRGAIAVGLVALFIVLIAVKNAFPALAIALDFVQVLAFFSALPLNWPSSLRLVFNVASSANFNIDLLALECTFESLSFASLYSAKVFVPVMFFFLFVIVFAVDVTIRIARSRCRAHASVSPDDDDDMAALSVGTLDLAPVRARLSVSASSAGRELASEPDPRPAADVQPFADPLLSADLQPSRPTGTSRPRKSRRVGDTARTSDGSEQQLSLSTASIASDAASGHGCRPSRDLSGSRSEQVDEPHQWAAPALARASASSSGESSQPTLASRALPAAGASALLSRPARERVFFRRARDQYTNAFVSALDMLYFNVVASAAQLFACTRAIDGKYVVTTQPSIACYSAEWNAALPSAVVAAGLIVFGIPMAVLTILWRHRAELDSDAFARRFGELYSKYDRPFYLWESVMYLRGALVSIVGVSASVSAPMRTFFVIFVFGVFLVLHMWARPYAEPRNDLLEAVSLVSLQLIALTGILFSGVELTPGERLGFAVVGLIVVMLACLTFLVTFVAIVRRRIAVVKHARRHRHAAAVDVSDMVTPDCAHLIDSLQPELRWQFKTVLTRLQAICTAEEAALSAHAQQTAKWAAARRQGNDAGFDAASAAALSRAAAVMLLLGRLGAPVGAAQDVRGTNGVALDVVTGSRVAERIRRAHVVLVEHDGGQSVSAASRARVQPSASGATATVASAADPKRPLAPPPRRIARLPVQ